MTGTTPERVPTQPLVNPKLMEATWKSAGGATTDEARRMQKQCGKDQEELTGFVIGFTSELGHEALGLALYMQMVVGQAFRRSGATFKKVKPGKILRAWEENFAVIDELKAEGYTRAPFVFPPHLTSEPAVLQYVVDAMTEFDPLDPISMTEDEFWHSLQVLKTYCDCLHDAGKKS